MLFFRKYAKHPAFYYHSAKGRAKKPMFYIYDSYLIGEDDWKLLLRPYSPTSIRSTPLDAYFIGLLVEKKHAVSLMNSGFDGLYTYFGSDTFSFGSMHSNWRQIVASARRAKMITSMSVAPGYHDERVRPWNSVS